MQHRLLKSVLLKSVLLTSAWVLAVPSALACPLSCAVTYAGATQHLTICPTPEPYRAVSVSIGERFRFKALHVTDSHLSPHISIDVYLETSQHPLLLQHVVIRPPYPVAPHGASVDLLGEQHLYAGPLERELIYRCALTPETP